MKTTELIERIKAFNNDRKKQVLSPDYEIIEPFYIVFQHELAGIQEVNTELLEALIVLQSRLEQLIIITPTGESRNAMTEDNINAEIAIQKATQ